MTSVTDWLAHTNTFAYHSNSHLATEAYYPNALSAAYSFDPLNQRTAISDARGSTTRASFAYTRDAASQLTSTSITDTGVSQPNHGCAYNPLEQLASVNSASSLLPTASN